MKDLSVYVKFKVKGQENTYLIAWTTTPWTLPGNVALAVGENIDYVKVKAGDEIFILAKERLSILADGYKVIEELKGKDFVGLEYEPLFPFLKNLLDPRTYNLEPAYKIYAADFVNTADGTGIVHTALMYGQDDFELGTKVGLPKHHLVNLEGKFIKCTGFLEGRFVREVDDKGKPTLAVDIIEDLKKRNLFFKQENYKHSYPHCWRCHTALIYYARDSWYIRMSDPVIKQKLISENKEINWEPEYIREGRFGEWLREVKDWAISRERYWGTPLPVWVCDSCKKIEVIGSIMDLQAKTKKSGNKYFVMRHGEAENNAKHIFDPKGDPNNHLTERGKKETIISAQKLKNKNIDIIVSSPFLRARETSEIVRKELGLGEKALLVDNRLHEYNEPSVDFVKQRIGEFIFEIEKVHSNKNILIVSHGNPIWVLGNLSKLEKDQNSSESNIFQTAEIQEIRLFLFPHNENYELDLHKPYIDAVALACSCGGNLIRTREVMDVWLDSGAMPFAQDHYPFDFAQDKPFEAQKIMYPADFICEAIDQTRGWFYTLHAIGILMGRGLAYKNVICLGHLLDASGEKMSKSLGNVVDPWLMMDKYGVDTLRLWMYSVNQPGESKNFDEKTVALIQQQTFGLLYNVLAFYELYKDPTLRPPLDKGRVGERSNSVLDQWILARLDELVELSTKNLDNYKLLEPVRGVKDFVGDLSTWYLRRSRERIKGEVANPELEQAQYGARATLYFVLKTLAKLLAPFAPFAAEDIWLRLKNESDQESVHLEEWPKISKSFFDIFGLGKNKQKKILENMGVVREIVTLGLEARQKAGIKVRQPLNTLEIKNFALSQDYIELIKDELNVKEVKQNNNIENKVVLDLNITPALKAEGEYREFMRELQDERKSRGLNPGDSMPISIERIYKKYKIMPNLQTHMLRVAAVASLICDNLNEPVNKEEIISACLLHDMGNIIKSNFEFLPESLEPEGRDYWEKVKEEYIKKYGNNDEKANEQVAKELKMSPSVVSLIKSISFSLICQHKGAVDMSVKVMHYADMRVSPYGVVSLEERMKEAKNRYKLESPSEEEERERLIECGREIEKQIFAKCKIKPEDINNETVTPLIPILKNFVTK